MNSHNRPYKGNILLVDDSEVNLMIGSKMLSHFGLHVITAKNGQEAIDCCKSARFALILMDLEMPGINGVTAAKIIRKEKLSFAQIYALSGSENASLHQACHHAHMNGFIKKTLTKENILKVLDTVF